MRLIKSSFGVLTIVSMILMFLNALVVITTSNVDFIWDFIIFAITFIISFIVYIFLEDDNLSNYTNSYYPTQYTGQY